MTLAERMPAPGRTTVGGVPEGFDALVIAKSTRERGGIHLHIARDDARASQLAETLAFFDPSLPVLQFPVAVPVFIGAIEATSSALRGEAVSEFAGWLKLLAAFSIVFVVLSYLLFEYVLEE